MSRLLIQLKNSTKSFHSILIFSDISLSVNEGDRFAIVGENGAGKTTLLQILAGSTELDTGEFNRSSDLTVGCLSQEVTIDPPTSSVRAYLEDSQLSTLERQMAICLEDPNRLDEWEQYHDTYVQLGGYQRIPIEKVLDGLKLNNTLLESPVSVLSGGQKVLVALAKVLIKNPDLLLLDEPTNHMDAEMLRWLKEMILQRKGATVIVSHDRKFLNETCNRLIEIDDGKLTTYGGSYDDYLAEKQRAVQRQIDAFEEQKEKKVLLKQKIKGMTFSKKKARAPKDRNIMAYDRWGEHYQRSQKKTLDALKAQLEEIEMNLLPNPKSKTILGMKFVSSPITSQVAIELDEVKKAFGDKILFSQVSRTVYKSDRLIITGSNGSGKTTLLRCISGLSSIDRGNIYCNPSVKISYLDQDVELLPMESCPLQYFVEKFHLTEEGLRRELHKAALGREELLHRPFSRMSVGQRKRLMLLSLLLEKPNVLLLDEPTNHLDLLTLEAFEKALLEFEGAIIAVSHDSTFIEKVATEVWDIQEDFLRDIRGNEQKEFND